MVICQGSLSWLVHTYNQFVHVFFKNQLDISKYFSELRNIIPTLFEILFCSLNLFLFLFRNFCLLVICIVPFNAFHFHWKFTDSFYIYKLRAILFSISCYGHLGQFPNSSYKTLCNSNKIVKGRNYYKFNFYSDCVSR